MAAWGAYCAGCGEIVKNSSRNGLLKTRHVFVFSGVIISILCSVSNIIVWSFSMCIYYADRFLSIESNTNTPLDLKGQAWLLKALI